MLETIIIFGVIAVVLVLTGRWFYRIISGKQKCQYCRREECQSRNPKSCGSVA